MPRKNRKWPGDELSGPKFIRQHFQRLHQDLVGACSKQHSDRETLDFARALGELGMKRGWPVTKAADILRYAIGLDESAKVADEMAKLSPEELSRILNGQ